MMSEDRNSTDARGVCHRCGWAGPVSKVGWRQRRRLKVGRAFGQLCAECLEELTLARNPTPDQAAKPTVKSKLKSVSDRDVA